VQRLPELEHHEIGDVDDSRNRAHPATLQAAHHPVGSPCSYVDGAYDAAAVARACSRILEQDLAFFVQCGLRWSHGGHDKRCSGQDSDFACDAPQAQAVPAVRSELERDELIIQIEHPAHVRPRPRIGGQDKQAGMILRETQVLRRAQHAARLDAPDLRLLDFHPREPRPQQRHRRFHSDDDIERPAYDRKGGVAAGIDPAKSEPVRIGMLGGLKDLPDYDLVESGRDRFDRFDVEPAHGEHVREFLRRHFRIDERAQPAFWKFHVNWARKRRSPS